MSLHFLQSGRYLLQANKKRTRLYDMTYGKFVFKSSLQAIGLASDESALLLLGDNPQVLQIDDGTTHEWHPRYDALFPNHQRLRVVQNSGGLWIEDSLTGEQTIIPTPSRPHMATSINDKMPAVKALGSSLVLFATWSDSAYGELDDIVGYDVAQQSVVFRISKHKNSKPRFTLSYPHQLLIANQFSQIDIVHLQDRSLLGRLDYLSKVTEGIRIMQRREIAVDVKTGKVAPYKQVYSIAFHPDDRSQAILGVDETLHFIKLDWDNILNNQFTAAQQQVIETPVIAHQIAWSAGAGVVAIESKDGGLQCYHQKSAIWNKL